VNFDDYVTQAEAARLLGVSSTCVQLLLKRGKLAGVKRGRFVLIAVTAIRARQQQLHREFPHRSGAAWSKRTAEAIRRLCVEPQRGEGGPSG